MPKRLTTRKTKKQQGGARGYAFKRPSAPSGRNSTYTHEDVAEFFNVLITKKIDYDHGQLQTSLPRFFIVNKSHGERGKIIIDPKWHKMINEATFTPDEATETKGYTPLYYALRYGADYMIIDMLFGVITDINRPNSGRDRSTPLIGLCYGKDETARVNYNYITNAIRKFVERKAFLNIANNRGETMLTWLNYKSMSGLIDL
jgi:hypothetical protein